MKKSAILVSLSSLSRLAFCAAFGLLALTPVAARAATIDTIRSSDNAIWGSVGTDVLAYKEPSNVPNNGRLGDGDHGWMPSGAVGLSMLGSSEARGIARNLYFAIEGGVSSGDVDYKGTLNSSPTVPYSTNINETIWNISGKLGHAFPVGDYVMLTPYGELGYRYWQRDFGNGQVEDYKHAEILGGLMGQVAPNSTLILTAYGAAGSTFNASMHASPVGLFAGGDYDLGSRPIYKTGGKVGINVNPKLEVFGAVDYTYFRYGQSAAHTDTSYEPNSFTGETRYRVGLAYHYK